MAEQAPGENMDYLEGLAERLAEGGGEGAAGPFLMQQLLHIQVRACMCVCACMQMDNLLLPAESAAVLLLYLIQQQPQRQLNHLDDENDETRRLCLSTHSIHLLRRAPGNRHLLDWCCILLAVFVL
eukprot:1140804-Pelagomonas_calceolata.AAC.2